MQCAHRRFLASELDHAAPDKARFHVIPVPYEESVSYGGGTAAGPAAILAASDQLELWDGESAPADLGIHTTPAVDCSGGAGAVLERIEAATATALSHGGLPVLLGGEHTVSLGALRALRRLRGRFGVIQFDAHADLRDRYGGTPYSHAAVMRRAVGDLGLPLFQIGVRALCREEVDYRALLGIGHLDAAALARHGIPDPLLPPDFPERIYVTFDLDGLDPAIMPATGTPVPGGLGWYDARRCLERAMTGRRVLGFDVVELAPIPGLHAADFTAARLVYDIMGIVQRLCRVGC